MIEFQGVDYLFIGVLLTSLVVLFYLSFDHFLFKLRTGTLGKVFLRRTKAPMIYNSDGSLVPVCSSLSTHNFRNGWCRWCGVSQVKLSISQDQVSGSILNPQNTSQILRPDFNSPTTATVNVKTDPVLMDVPDPLRIESDPQSMDLGSVSAYCLKCKIKTSIIDPEYYDLESRRGIRRYLKGSCSVCGSKINAIVKRGST